MIHAAILMACLFVGWGLSALVFGTLALVLHNMAILKMKLTIVDGILAVVLLGGLALNKLPLKMLLGEAIRMSDAGWRRLTVSYGVFFLLCAVANEIIWRTQSDAVWVFFRFPGMPALAVLFSLTQVPLLLRENKAMEAGDDILPPPTD